MPPPDLDNLLDRILLFLDESGGVPVLLSMLVLVFRSMTKPDLAKMPQNRMELYECAIAAALDPKQLGADQLDVCMRMLRHIAFANHTRLRRQFTAADARSWLQDRSDELALWQRLEAVKGEDADDIDKIEEYIPLIRVLADSSFEFRHLSFQEGLCAIELARQPADGGSDKVAGGGAAATQFWRNGRAWDRIEEPFWVCLLHTRK